MKKTYASLMLIAAAFSSLHSQSFNHKGNNESFINASQYEQHTSAGSPAAPTVQYYNDVIIKNAAENQGRVRLGVSFNGWLYAAYNTVDSATGNGGITIRSSRDNGQNWTTLDSYSSPNILYPSFDIVVAGTDTNSLVLYLAGINHNTSTGNYILFVDRYNATTGAFNGSNYNYPAGTRTIYDVALATDYRAPAVGASPYSVGLLYSTYSSTYDSINFLASIDGGATWGVRQVVATTGGYNRNVSLAYGRSLSASNGRYFAAWEQLGGSTARNGHIYTSRNQTTVDLGWITPVNLDSVSSTMINLCRNPQIAVSFGALDNDSASCSAVVMVERDYIGDGSDYDLLGFYNKRSHYTNYWYRLDIVNSGENDLQPDVTYDPGANNFLATYYDSTNGKLPYIVAPMNLLTPSTWTTISPQYNDQTTNLNGAWPRVEINQMVTMAAHAWIAKGVAMFDAEYIYAGVQNNQGHGGLSLNPYPNPANSSVNISFGLESNQNVSISIFNMEGQLIDSRNLGSTAAGLHNETFDVSNWNNGVYMVRINSIEGTITRNLVVAH